MDDRDFFNNFERKSKEIKEAQGTFREDRDKKSIEPEVIKKPRPLPWVCPTGKKVFRRLIPVLSENVALTKMDIDLFCMACNEYGQYIDYQTKMNNKDFGRTQKVKAQTSKGEVFEKGEEARPEVTLSNNARKAALEIFIRFGFTPIDRAKIPISAKASEKKIDDLEAVLKVSK